MSAKQNTRYGKNGNLRAPSTSQARERGRKGGKSTARKARERKSLREAVELLLSMPCNRSDYSEQLAAIGLPETEQTNQMALTLALFNEALNGNVQAFNSMRDTVGEKPVSRTELTGKDGAALYNNQPMSIQQAKAFLQELEDSL